MNMKKVTPYLLAAAAMIFGYLLISPTAQAAGSPPDDSKEITQLLQDTKFEAHELEKDAGEIETFARSGLSWQSHSEKLGAIRRHINKSGKLLAQMQEMRHEGSPWQQKAIDEIAPLLRELASNTQVALDHFAANKETLHMGTTYQDYLKSNSEMAKELAALISDYVEYGEHKAEFERLGEKLVASERQ